MTTITQTITAPPTAPSRADPSTFATRADAHVTWQATNATQLNTLSGQINTVAGEVNTNRVDAEAAQAAAEVAQAAAENAAALVDFMGAYAGGTTYALGESVIDGGYFYISIQGGNTGHTPASNPAWWQRIGQVIYPGAAAASYGTSFSTTSTSYVDTGLSVTITPKSAASTILLICSVNRIIGNGTSGIAIFYRGATALSGGPNMMATNGTANAQTIMYLDSPATASAVTYKLRAKNSNAYGDVEMYLAGGEWGHITAIEVMG